MDVWRRRRRREERGEGGEGGERGKGGRIRLKEERDRGTERVEYKETQKVETSIVWSRYLGH